ncbi:MAG: VWA domain-containing protein, partial [Deltaproteobacteria bacterium]|nr:VWA domain-containing protein [Deltaproteobacteria bacterium]
PSDPDGWRFIAASVVVNYLAVAAEPSITYRVALVSYAERAETLASLSELGETCRMQLTQMLDPDNPVMGDVGGWTNPHLALQLTLKELEEHPSPNPVRPPIVIILTDGDLRDNTLGLSAEQYFEQVRSAVLAISKQGAVVHAVLLGDRARQNQREWEDLTALTGGQVLLVGKAEELPEAYVRLVRIIVGTIGVGFGTKSVEARETTELPVRELRVSLDENELPYIDSLVVTVWQTRRDISVRFIDPDGQVLVPIPGEVERRGSDYVVVWWIRGADLLAGDWKVLLSGGSQEGRVQIFVDYIPLRSALLIPSVAAARGEPVTFESLLMNRDGLPFDATEALEIQLNLYKEPEKRLVSSERMTFTSEDGKIRHRLKHTFDEAGVYGLELLPRLHLKSGGTRFLRPPEGLRWLVKIADLPVIREVRLEPIKAEIGQPVHVRVTVERTEGQKGLTVLAWMKEHDSARTVWEEDLRPGLRGAFEGGPFSLTSAGTYNLTVTLQGEAPLPGEEVGLLYGPDTAYPIQKSVEYSVQAPTGLRIGNIEVGREGQAFQGEPVPIRVQVHGPERASVQKVEATIRGEEPIALHDDGRLPDEREGDGVFSGALLAPTVEGSYRIRVVAQGESMYGVPLSDQGEAELTVIRVDLRLESIEVGREGQAFRGEMIPIQVEVFLPEGASVQSVGAAIEDREPISLHDDGQPPDKQKDDGIFSGTLLALDSIGTYRIQVMTQGESVYGVPLSDKIEMDLTVELSSWDRRRPWLIGGSISLLGLLVLIMYFFWQG